MRTADNDAVDYDFEEFLRDSIDKGVTEIVLRPRIGEDGLVEFKAEPVGKPGPTFHGFSEDEMVFSLARLEDAAATLVSAAASPPEETPAAA